MNLNKHFAFVFFLLTTTFAVNAVAAIDAGVVFAEKDGLIAVEAEHFCKQTATDIRSFHLTTAANI